MGSKLRELLKVKTMIKTIIIYGCVLYWYNEWVIYALGFVQLLTDITLHLNKECLKLRVEESNLLKENNNLLFKCKEKLVKSAGLSRSVRMKTVEEVKELCK